MSVKKSVRKNVYRVSTLQRGSCSMGGKLKRDTEKEIIKARSKKIISVIKLCSSICEKPVGSLKHKENREII